MTALFRERRKRYGKMKCDKQTEVYSRIVGYFRPVQNWNKGKKQEFKDRKEYKVEKDIETGN